MAKNTAVAACDYVVDQAVQLHGGFGYLRDAEVERHYRDARIMGIGGGTTEIMNEIIAKGMGSEWPSWTPLSTRGPRPYPDEPGGDARAARRAGRRAGTRPAPAAARSTSTRHHARGKLLARERIELLVDRDAPFLELSPVAAWGTDFPVGASVVTGIGVVEGVECVIIANDPTVRGGAVNPYTLKKTQRAGEIALANRLPLVNLVESGGADLPTQAEIFIPGGAGRSAT